MARRATTGLAAVILAAGVAFCGDSPSAPTGTTTPPSAGSVVSVRITGPTSIAPRGTTQSIAQFAAIATFSGGSTAEVTARAVWNSSNFSVIHPTTKPGEMQAEQPGQAVVSAVVDGVMASVGVTVTEAGTFTLSGVVTDAATGRGLSGVIVRRDPMIRSVATDANGRYTFFGMLGPTTVSASLWGFETQTYSLNLSADSVQDFVLSPKAQPAADLSGNWTLIITASPACRAGLPEVARERRLDVTLFQQSAKVTFTTAPSVEDICKSLGDPPGTASDISGTLFGDQFEFGIAGDTGYDGYSSVCVSEHPNPGETVGFSLFGTGPLNGPEINVTVKGDVEYWAGPRAAGRPDAICRATDHAVVLRRR